MRHQAQQTKLSNSASGVTRQRVQFPLYSIFSFMLITLVVFSAQAFALDIDVASGVGDIAENIVKSTNKLPALISSLAYLVGIFFGTIGLLKLKSHVEAPTQTPLSAAYSRFLIGGALIALPMVYEVMVTTIRADADAGYSFDDIFNGAGLVSSLFGQFSGILGDVGITRDLNAVLYMIIDSVSTLPKFISALSYLIGLFMGFTGLIKLRDHIEDPDRNPLKEAVMRFVIGGCMLALPTIYTVMAATVAGDDPTDLLSSLTSLISTAGFLESSYSDSRGCTEDILSGMLESATLGLSSYLFSDSGSSDSAGTMICQAYGHAIALPSFLSAVSKLLGFYLGFAALLKLRDHIANPQQTPISQPLSRFLAGGCFLALDSVVGIVRSSVTPASSAAQSILGSTTSDYSGTADCSSDSTIAGFISDVTDSISSSVGSAINDAVSANLFDTASAEPAKATGMGKTVYCAVTDILGPLHSAMTFFCFCMGMIFIMIGISRLLKSEQDGARAPLGIGTIFTFITGGVLLSFSDFVKIINMNLFNTAETAVSAKWTYASSLGSTGQAEFYATLAGIIKFMIIIGLISFVRGLFIIRNVAEGNQQASAMAGITHLIAGSLAINIGPLLNLVQVTLGITPENSGILFS